MAPAVSFAKIGCPLVMIVAVVLRLRWLGLRGLGPIVRDQGWWRRRGRQIYRSSGLIWGMVLIYYAWSPTTYVSTGAAGFCGPATQWSDIGGPRIVLAYGLARLSSGMLLLLFYVNAVGVLSLWSMGRRAIDGGSRLFGLLVLGHMTMGGVLIYIAAGKS